MTRTAFGVLLFATAASAQGDKIVWDFDARRPAVDEQRAALAKLGFDPKNPAPEGDPAEFRKRAEAATKVLDEMRAGLARHQAAVQGEINVRAKAYNDDVRRFRAGNVVARSNMHFLDKVAANPTKAGFERNREGYAKDWDTRFGRDINRVADMEGTIREALKPYLADAEKAGYAPHGMTNPFTGDYAAPFYDDQGNVARAVWTGGKGGWDKYQADAKAKVATLRARAAEIEAKAEEQDAAFAGYEATVKALDALIGPAADKLNRAELVGNWKGEVVQGTNKIAVTLVIEADGKISNTAANGLTGKGMWTRAGDQLRVVWATGEVAAWTIKDGKITGGGGTTPKGEKVSIAFTRE